MSNFIEKFVYPALNIIINDILELDIIVPNIIFDYSNEPSIRNGYYMYQNISGTIITLNMNCIMSLKNENDIKTVIVYGFIHEIVHMYQKISSKYNIDKNFYTTIEDSADNATIQIVRNCLPLINSRLNFEFNETFLIGIERQLKPQYIKDFNIEKITWDDMQGFDENYTTKVLAGALSTKLNYNFDYLYNIISSATSLRIVFPNKRNYYIDLVFGGKRELNTLVSLISITDFKLIHTSTYEYTDGSGAKILTFSLI